MTSKTKPTSPSDDPDRFISCPACGHENIPGMEICDNCQSDLTYLGKKIHAVTSSSLEKGALTDTLEKIESDNVYRIYQEMSVKRTMEVMSDLQITSIMVEDDFGDIAGVFSDQEILKNVSCKKNPPLNEPVREYMSANYVRLAEDCTVIQALSLSVVNNFHVIIDSGFQRLVNYRDLLNYIVDFYPTFGKITSDN
ncbi:MAG: CBS domain-containing protein [Candidatus Hodarchaeales archaeon]|jgi:predicted transcriptional regulator